MQGFIWLSTLSAFFNEKKDRDFCWILITLDSIKTERRFTTTYRWCQPHWNSSVSYFSITPPLIGIQYSRCKKSMSQHATSTAPPSAAFHLAGILNTCSFPANYRLYIMQPQTLFSQKCSLHLLLASLFNVISCLYNIQIHVYVQLNISSQSSSVCFILNILVHI